MKAIKEMYNRCNYHLGKRKEDVMIERRKKERRSMVDRRSREPGRRIIRNEMGCFNPDNCRRENVSDRRNVERRLLHRRVES